MNASVEVTYQVIHHSSSLSHII